MRKPVIGITLGDAAGIGPEIVVKAVDEDILKKYVNPVILGDERVFLRGMASVGLKVDYRVFDTIEEAVSYEGVSLFDTKGIDGLSVEIGQVSAECGKEEGDVLIQAIDLCSKGLLDGICFAPLNKAALKAGGYNFPSEHEMFAHHYGINTHYGEMNVVDNIWNIRVTGHIPFKDITKHLTIERFLDSVELGYRTLRQSGIKEPKIAVAALNPHGGEYGTCGREEIDIIIPGMEIAKQRGINLEGPIPADVIFLKAINEGYNGIITMYHDQGQIAIKLFGLLKCTTVSAGLPHPITTPAHGTAFDIAGTGTCSIEPFEDALSICARMALNQNFD